MPKSNPANLKFEHKSSKRNLKRLREIISANPTITDFQAQDQLNAEGFTNTRGGPIDRASMRYLLAKIKRFYKSKPSTILDFADDQSKQVQPTLPIVKSDADELLKLTMASNMTDSKKIAVIKALIGGDSK